MCSEGVTTIEYQQPVKNHIERSIMALSNRLFPEFVTATGLIIDKDICFKYPKVETAPNANRPIISIESQSGPGIDGINEEQSLRRRYPSLSKEDTYVTASNLPIDPDYLTYLEQVLNLDLPCFVEVDQNGFDNLSQAITNNSINRFLVSQLIALSNKPPQIEFFSLTGDEEAVIQHLEKQASRRFTTAAANFEGIMQMTTKSGFRKFANKYGWPIAPGVVCENENELAFILEKKSFSEASGFFIKSDHGIGGEELQSNISVTREQLIENLSEKGITQYVEEVVGSLSGRTYPIVIEDSLDHLPLEGSLHVCLDSDGNIKIPPQVFGQIAEGGTYQGGYFQTRTLDAPEQILEYCMQSMLPPLIHEGLTGYHCFDFRYNEETGEYAFLEDNTRQGALDLVDEFVQKVVRTNFTDSQDYSWYHLVSELNTKTTNFSKIAEILEKQLSPQFAEENDYFLLLSNPDTLPYGGSLYLTVVTPNGVLSTHELEEIHTNTMKLLNSQLIKK